MSLIRRVAAPDLEALLTQIIGRLAPSEAISPLDLPTRIEIHAHSLQMLFPVHYRSTIQHRLADGEQMETDAANPSQLRLILPIRIKVRGGRTSIIAGKQPSTQSSQALIKALRDAQTMLRRDASGLPVLETAPNSSYQRHLVRLAFLAPDLQRAILDGRQPPDLTLSRIMDGHLPLLWSEQAKMLGAPATD